MFYKDTLSFMISDSSPDIFFTYFVVTISYG